MHNIITIPHPHDILQSSDNEPFLLTRCTTDTKLVQYK